MFSDPLVNWLVYLIFGGLMLLALFRLPEKIVLLLGRYISPNWVSVLHTPLAWIGYFVLYKNGYQFWGVELIIFAAALDRLDGRMAMVLSEHNKDSVPKGLWAQMSYRGGTPYGKIIDPLMDKFAVLPIYAHVGYRFINGLYDTAKPWLLWLLGIGAVLIGIMLLTELAGQLIRLDRFRKWRRRKDKGATWAGKVKALAQWIWLIFYPIWDQGWLEDEYKGGFIVFLNTCLLGIVFLAVLSVVSKIRPIREGWTKRFRHTTKGDE